ncbi:phosphoglycerate mutase [Guyanagaster necrorhizus]|uniref:Phosphoglycerate mutase n=1 Tax=Guyanagaster necrorhizus TaxID=856835 RepID=A0A9P7VWM3_9AGAR|nr:phosphoglycerate mutase [Guyanagaster necrorhizus MCA 3950]KAG7448891.1 phosphoglycerate mutase [Guyanagaster necrorhizus MCA 3950]
MIIVTFIRHGESTDNPRAVWGGWKDAPLSDLGRKQARALGEHLASTKIDVIYASPLLRAHHTGMAVQNGQPKPPPLILNPNLREQHFGIAEGYSWCYTYPDHMSLDECYKTGIFPAFFDRSGRFPGGESIDELAGRAHGAVKECIFAHLTEEDGFHIALASHGLCIGELVHALLSYDPESNREESYTGLMNTAWTRAVISLDPSYQGHVDSDNPPPLRVKVTHIAKEDHLKNIDEITDVDGNFENERKTEALAFFGGAGHTN